MSDAAEHVAAWEAAGLIDRTTADRLRAADIGEVEPIDRGLIDKRPGTSGVSGASALFGPAVAIAEVFGYLGGAFLLAAWFAWIGSLSANMDQASLILGIGWAVAALTLVALGTVLHRSDERRRRAGGVAFLIAIATAGGAAASLASGAGLGWPHLAVIGSAVALALSISLRAFHPSVLTQIGLLSAFTTFAASLLAWLEQVIYPSAPFSEASLPGTGPDPMLLVVGSAAWWLAAAALIGLIGLGESRAAERGDDLAAVRRAGTSRLWGGFVAIIGLATAVSRSDYLVDGSYARVLEPWVGDMGLLIVSGVLIERAFRREATSYIYAAALGLIVGLSDFNFAYLSDSTESGLFVEGIILLGAGVAADRLRRRVGRPADPTLGEAVVFPPAEPL
jgi:hypothetical protein